MVKAPVCVFSQCPKAYQYFKGLEKKSHIQIITTKTFDEYRYSLRTWWKIVVQMIYFQKSRKVTVAIFFHTLWVVSCKCVNGYSDSYIAGTQFFDVLKSSANLTFASIFALCMQRNESGECELLLPHDKKTVWRKNNTNNVWMLEQTGMCV